MLLGKQILSHRVSRFKIGISRICYRVEDPRLLYLSEQLRLERSSRLTNDKSIKELIGSINSSINKMSPTSKRKIRNPQEVLTITDFLLKRIVDLPNLKHIFNQK